MIRETAFIKAAAVDVAYGPLVALAGVDLEIPRGQFVSIIGPSGCGKSTLLRLFAGLARPTAGAVSVDDDQDEPPSKASSLSFVFQEATLLPWRTVRDNVRLPLELAGEQPTAADRKVAEVLNLVGLSDFAAQFPNELSGGMKMRVALARALAPEPALLLLDEPFGALDDITRQKLNEELSALWAERQWTVVFVTHNIAEAVFLSQRVVVLSPRPGRIVADLPIALPTPRRRELRAHADFARLTGEVSEALFRSGA